MGKNTLASSNGDIKVKCKKDKSQYSYKLQTLTGNIKVGNESGKSKMESQNTNAANQFSVDNLMGNCEIQFGA